MLSKVCFLFLVTFFVLLAAVETTAKKNTEIVYYSVPVVTKTIALTFDDGPDALCTRQVLDILDRYKIKATFFVVGQKVEKHPEITREIVRRGHEIGNHTYNHHSLTFFKTSEIAGEILKTEKIIQQVTGIKTNLFRPPAGRMSGLVQKFCADNNYKIILWSYTPGARERKMLNTDLKLKNGSIILLHDSRSLRNLSPKKVRNISKTLPLIIEKLKKEGYSFTTVSQLLNQNKKIITSVNKK